MASKMNKVCKEAFDKGYRVVDGDVRYNNGKKLSLYLNAGYFRFSFRVKSGERVSMQVHKLVAYQKYGKKMFRKGIQVRHRDGDSKNNRHDNIIIGTSKQNNMDKSPEVRLRSAIRASSFVKKHDHDDIVKMRNEGASYAVIMKKHGIKSKGAISFIVNKSMSAKK